MTTKIFVPDDFYCPITGELMKDPVSDPEGHTYERTAILRWLSNHTTSPMTRNDLLVKNLNPNITLKKSIDSIRDKLSEDQLCIKSNINETDLKVFTDSLDDIELDAYYKDSNLLVKIFMPDVEDRPPVDACLCLDVSGSMGTMATLKGDKGETIDYGITVLSLTICAAKTILGTLNDNDNISIITYTDKAKRIIESMPCTVENKSIIEKELDELKPLYTTNIWDGVKTSLDVLRENSPKNRMKGLFLLTDGVPNEEPARGHEYMLEKYFKDNNFECMINCYGFGYELRSDLLDNLSKISGGDGYSFIPDSSILGNIFIHGISNFFTTAVIGPTLNIELTNNFKFKDGTTSKSMKLNSLKYGQNKNILFELQSPDIDECDLVNVAEIKLSFNDKTLMRTIGDYNKPEMHHYYEQLYRYKTYTILDDCIKFKKFNDNSFKTLLDNLLLEISFNKDIMNNGYIENIVFDLEGQIKEALNMTSKGEREDWFSKWGIHYLRSLKGAYENEICNNFKDKGVSNFGGELFESLIDEVSSIFDDMPPPKKTIQPERSGYRTGYRTNLNTSLPRLTTMASYNQSGEGCCAKGSRIRMEDNSFRKVEDLNKGDEVITIDVKGGVHHFETGFIECVVVTKCYNNIENMVTIYGNDDIKLQITPYHPIIGFNTGSTWIFPKDITDAEIIECEEMYTFVLNNRQSVLVEDFIFATYGHELRDDVIKHNYFGNEYVINDLKQFPTYNLGFVHLTKDMFIRDNGGDVIRIRFDLDYESIIKNLYYANL